MDNLYEDLFSSSAFWCLNKRMVRILGATTALYLVELVDWMKFLRSTRELLSDNYFYHTQENIENNTGLSYHLQSKAIQSLVEYGILDTVKRGMPNRLWYKINFENARNLLVNGDNCGLKLVLENSKTSSGIFKPVYNKNEDNKNIPTKKIEDNNQQFQNSIPIQTTQNIPSSKRTIIPVAPPPAAVVDPLAADKDLALQLANIVRSQKHIKIDTQTINQWAKVIAKGRKKLGLNAARVKRVLDWYPSHLEIESKYKYIAYCGSSLIEKFIKLEDCMLRDKPKTQSQPEPEPEYTSSHSQVIPDTMKKITHEELMARWEREEEEEDEYLRSLYLPQEKKSDAKLFEELKMMNEMSEEELERIYGNGGDCDDN